MTKVGVTALVELPGWDPSLTHAPVPPAPAVWYSPRYLLIGKKTGYEGLYLTPGGRVEEYEPLEEALRREILEETGIILLDCRFHSVYERLDRAAGQHAVILCYTAQGAGTPHAGDDAGEVLAVTLSELCALYRAGRLTPMTEWILQRLFRLEPR